MYESLKTVEKIRILVGLNVDLLTAKIIDVAKESLIIELTGNQAKIDAFMRLLEGFTIKEFVRTGITGLVRGVGDIEDYIAE